MANETNILPFAWDKMILKISTGGNEILMVNGLIIKLFYPNTIKRDKNTFGQL